MPIVLDGSNGITAPGGTAAAPSITTVGDTNTGIFFPAADTIAFVEGGVESLRLNSSGKLVYTSSALSTASAGLSEYDGTATYFTPSGTQRGVVPGMQFFRLNGSSTLTTAITAQNLFGVGCTLTASTVYAFNIMFTITKTSTATAHTISMGFAGTATVNNILYSAYSVNSNGALPIGVDTTNSIGVVNTAAATAISESYGNATQVQMYCLTGTVSINAGGTFIPQITISAAVGPYSVTAGSFISIYPIGAAGSNVSVGAWA
jgi:hypothetical protein